MIIAIYGTHDSEFNRLNQILLKVNKNYDGGIIALTENRFSTNIQSRGYVNDKEFTYLLKNAEIVISHAGIGSLITISEFNKRAIIVPRLLKYGEHFDNHQVEISKYLENHGVPVIYDTKIDKDLIKKAVTLPFNQNTDFPNMVKTLITNYFNLE